MRIHTKRLRKGCARVTQTLTFTQHNMHLPSRRDRFQTDTYIPTLSRPLSHSVRSEILAPPADASGSSVPRLALSAQIPCQPSSCQRRRNLFDTPSSLGRKLQRSSLQRRILVSKRTSLKQSLSWKQLMTYLTSNSEKERPRPGGNTISTSGKQSNVTLLAKYCKDNVPRSCDHSLLSNFSRYPRPCSLTESFLSVGNTMTLQLKMVDSTALRYVMSWKAIDNAEGGRY